MRVGGIQMATEAVGLGTSVGGSISAKGSSKKAAKKQQAYITAAQNQVTAGMNAANTELESGYETASGKLDNFAQLGESALAKLAYGLGFDVPGFDTTGLERGGLLENFNESKFRTDPGYNFVRSEGQRGIENSAAGRNGGIGTPGVLSGATLKALTKFNQGHADQQYTNAYNRYNTDRKMQTEMLSGSAAMGQQALNNQATLRQNASGAKANNIISANDSLAGLYLAKGNVASNDILRRSQYFQNSLQAGSDAFQSFFDPGYSYVHGQSKPGGESSGSGGIAGIAGMAASIFSDRRLKSDIRRIGTHPLGIGIYRYIIFGKEDEGVMADEVRKVMPEAVTKHETGFDMVNYSMLEA